MAGKSIARRLFELNEPYAAGLFEFPDREPIYRYANAAKRFWELADIMPYDGGALYPCGRCMGKDNFDKAVRPDFSYTLFVDWNLLKEKADAECYEAFRAEYGKVSGFPTPHTIGGAGYTHSFINYSRILEDGICGYRRRVEALEAGDFREGLLLVLEGIEIYRQRLLRHLREQKNVHPGLIEALEHADEPPRTLYEAIVLWNFVYYVDGCDDIGRMDQHLIRFWQGEDVVDLLHELYSHVDTNDGWSGALGPDYNELTLQCIRAAHLRQPLCLF